MDWLLLRDLLNARLYPHRIKTKGSRLNGKALFQVGVYIAFLSFAVYLLFSPARDSRAEAAQDHLDYAATVYYFATQTEVAGYTSTPTATSTLAITSTGTPGTPFLTFPFVSHLGDYYLSEHMVFFSYYYPDLGGVNCHEDNWQNGRCKDTTASGMSWRNNMGKALAVHPDMLEILPYGSVVRVTDPAPIAGDYMVIDLCGGCNINGYYYFDFLFYEMPVGMNWSDPLTFQVMRVGFLNLLSTPTLTPVYQYLPTWTLTASPIVETSTVVIPSETPTVTFTIAPSETVTQTPAPTETLTAEPQP
jgi:hypothetical protein